MRGPVSAANARPRSSRGQALIEFALILPLIFVLSVNAVNFGGFLFAWITVANAARTGATYWASGPLSNGAPSRPTSAQVLAVVTKDVSSLINKASLVVVSCSNNNGTTDCGFTPPSDPEAASYLLGVVDVTYTYKPLIPVFNFGKIGISVGFFPTAGISVHRRVAMRVMS
jgi:Flp pilus assembly protein TadG